MSALLLVVALATAAKPPADVQVASVGEVSAAKPPVVEVIASVAQAVAAKPTVEEVPAVAEAAVAKPTVEEVPAVAEAAAAKSETEFVPAVWTVAQAEAPDQPVWEPVVQRGSCGLLTLYTRNSFLSGPWGAARRLAAARRLGDADEVKRMEAKLAALLTEALNAEREGR